MNDEQGFLDLYYGQQVLRLQHVYAEDLAIKVRSRTCWDAVWEEMRNVQYRIISPPNREPFWAGRLRVPRMIFGVLDDMKSACHQRLEDG